MSAVPPDARADRRAWAGLAVLTLPLVVVSLDLSILYLALPEIAVSLRADATQQLWILDAYGLMVAGLLLVAGPIGDRVGRRRLLLTGTAAFAAASLLAAWAPGPESLIAARVLLGVAGACLMPPSLALISTLFLDPTRRTTAIAVWMTTFSGGIAFGPVVGGLLLERFWWGSVFLVGLPPLLLFLVLAPLLLPADRVGAGARTIDPRSVLLLLGTTFPLVHALKETASAGPGLGAAVALVVGLVCGSLFVARQRALVDPMLDLTLFTHRTLVAAVAVMFLALLAMNGVNFLLPQMLQVVVGLGPAAAGVALVPLAAVTVAGSLATPALVRLVGQRAVLVIGPSISVVGAVLIALLVDRTTSPTVLVALAGVLVLGVVPVTVLGTVLVVGAAPPERTGAAAAISETAGELGAALGVAVVGSVVAALYGARIGALLPAGLPDEVARAAAESPADALAAGEGLPPGPAADLRDAAATGFADAFSSVGWVSAGLGVVIVALVAMLLRPQVAPAQQKSETDRAC